MLYFCLANSKQRADGLYLINLKKQYKMELNIPTLEEIKNIIDISIKNAFESLAPQKTEISKRLSFDEGLKFLNESGYKTSESQLYKRTMLDQVPCLHFGNKIIFDRNELQQWAESRCRVNSTSENATLLLAKSATKKLKAGGRK